MRSQRSKPFTDAERSHIERVKMLPCSVCDAPAPSDAHHIRQGRHFAVIALCKDCHQGKNGWHGTKTNWRIYKTDEIDALNTTLSRLA